MTVELIGKKLKETGIETVLLRPFLLTEGHHVTQDINKIWAKGLTNQGLKVSVDLKPLGEYRYIRKHFIDLIKESTNEKS